MASRKKTPARKKAAHSDADSEHYYHVVVTVKLYPLKRIRRKKGTKAGKARKASSNQAKAFLKWVTTQL